MYTTKNVDDNHIVNKKPSIIIIFKDVSRAVFT